MNSRASIVGGGGALPAKYHRLLAPLTLIPAVQTRRGEADWFPAVDILEDGDGYLFRIDLPDVDPENVEVTIEGDGLLISGDRPHTQPDTERTLRVERPQGHFERRFFLPDDASRRELESTLERGVLELRVHKVAPEPRTPVPPNTPPRLRICPTP
jgi:HSP20 family molecular chaperone IbpA